MSFVAFIANRNFIETEFSGQISDLEFGSKYLELNGKNKVYYNDRVIVTNNIFNIITGIDAGEWIAFLDSDDLWMPEKLEHQINFMKKHGYILSYTEYEKIDEESKPLNIYVSGPEQLDKRRMYNYDYIGQLTMMYSAKEFGLIQIKDIKKNNDYAIRLKLFKKSNINAYLLKEDLAKYRVRKISISHDKFKKSLKVIMTYFIYVMRKIH